MPIILVGLKKDLRPQDTLRDDNVFVHPREVSKSGARPGIYTICAYLILHL